MAQDLACQDKERRFEVKVYKVVENGLVVNFQCPLPREKS
jgi:hypothetical protein